MTGHALNSDCLFRLIAKCVFMLEELISPHFFINASTCIMASASMPRFRLDV